MAAFQGNPCSPPHPPCLALTLLLSGWEPIVIIDHTSLAKPVGLILELCWDYLEDLFAYRPSPTPSFYSRRSGWVKICISTSSGLLIWKIFSQTEPHKAVALLDQPLHCVCICLGHKVLVFRGFLLPVLLITSFQLLRFCPPCSAQVGPS